MQTYVKETVRKTFFVNHTNYIYIVIETYSRVCLKVIIVIFLCYLILNRLFKALLTSSPILISQSEKRGCFPGKGEKLWLLYLLRDNNSKI